MQWGKISCFFIQSIHPLGISSCMHVGLISRCEGSRVLWCGRHMYNSTLRVSQAKGHKCALGSREVIGAYQVLLGSTNKHPRPLWRCQGTACKIASVLSSRFRFHSLSVSSHANRKDKYGSCAVTVHNVGVCLSHMLDSQKISSTGNRPQRCKSLPWCGFSSC